MVKGKRMIFFGTKRRVRVIRSVFLQYIMYVSIQVQIGSCACHFRKAERKKTLISARRKRKFLKICKKGLQNQTESVRILFVADADVAQQVERILGKDEVTGSNPVISSS